MAGGKGTLTRETADIRDVPLLDSTKKMVNAEAIAMMKPNAIVLNFARDLLVDEEAMVEALAAGKIKKYVSDFPNPTTVGAKGCIVTPHLGASTAESEDNCAIMAVRETTRRYTMITSEEACAKDLELGLVQREEGISEGEKGNTGRDKESHRQMVSECL